MNSGVVLSQILLEPGRPLNKPPLNFSLGVGCRQKSDEVETDDLPLKARELGDIAITVESSDSDIVKIIVVALSMKAIHPLVYKDCEQHEHPIKYDNLYTFAESVYCSSHKCQTILKVPH